MIRSHHDDNGANEVLLRCRSNIYRQDAAAAGPPNVGAGVVRVIQHPFETSTTTNTTTNNTSSKSPGGMDSALGYAAAFTSAQWKELERQAMIYKYMVASVPVPPHLLLPTADASAPHSPLGSGCGCIFNLEFGNNKDPELGRCKRTDGKKWRCSRDVAPHQKYCERHMQRGRPRSRKPVEGPPNNIKKKTRLHLPTHPTPTPKQLLRSTVPPNEIENSSSLLLDSPKTSEHFYVLPYGEQSNRGLDWMVEGEMVTMDTSEQQWQQLMTEGSIYSTTAPSIFQQSYEEEEPMNLLSLPDIVGNSPNEYNLFLHSYQPPRDFIDAWSNDSSNNENKNNHSSVTAANGNLSPSSLNFSMAMAVGNSLDHEIGQNQMGLDVARAINYHQKSQVSSWLHPVCTPGGPLAEVLRPSSVAIGSNPGSPCRRN